MIRRAFFLFALLVPTMARAEGEVTAAVGALLGGSVNALLAGNLSVTQSFNNAPTYGVRVGWVGYPVGIEGSVVGSPTGLSASALGGQITLDARVIYAEANVLVIIIPGPLSPFVTAGGGLHAFNFSGIALLDVEKLGYNFGAGVKANIKRITIRVEGRDHVTRFTLGDLGLGGLPISASDLTLHNVEVSAGVGFRF